MGRLEDIAARNRATGPARHSLPPEQMKWVFIGLGVVLVIICVGGLVSTCNERAARERELGTNDWSPPVSTRHDCRLLRNELEPFQQRLRGLFPTATDYCAELAEDAKFAEKRASSWAFMAKYSIALSDLAKQCAQAGVEATHAAVQGQIDLMGIEIAGECAPKARGSGANR